MAGKATRCLLYTSSELEHRPFKRYEIPASKLVLELGYSIDYKDEKEDFEPDEADTVELINGERMPWEPVSYTHLPLRYTI